MKPLKSALAIPGFISFLLLLCLVFNCQQPAGVSKAEEEMKALANQSLGVWNKGDFELVNKLFSPEYVRHDVDIYEDIVGLDAFKKHVTFFRTAYPDFNVAVDELIAKEDKVIMRWTVTGTNTGPRGDEPPTGKKMKISGCSISRNVDGKVAEEWVYYNQLKALQQLGYSISPPE